MPIIKIPIRMCCSCRKREYKKTMVRFVNIDGKISIDPSYKLSTRGAYLCKDPKCLAKAKKSHTLERVLSAKLSNEYMEYLERLFSLYESSCKK